MATTTTHFDIHATERGSYRAYIGQRLTFDEAENLARWHAARRGIRVQVDKIVMTPKRRQVEEVATVVRDPLGRIWTDLTWHGASFV